jgi:hypothetical protein
LKKLGIEITFLNIIKAIYDKPIANVLLNGKNTETMPSKIMKQTREKTEMRLFNIVLEFLSKAIKQEKEMRGVQIRKEEVKLSLLADDRCYT